MIPSDRKAKNLAWRKWYADNRDKMKAYYKERYRRRKRQESAENKEERLKNQRKYQRKYYQKHKNYILHLQRLARRKRCSKCKLPLKSAYIKGKRFDRWYHKTCT